MEQHGKACLPTSPSQALPHTTSLYPDIRVIGIVAGALHIAGHKLFEWEIISHFEENQNMLEIKVLWMYTTG